MKILDRYILFNYLKTFASVFIILMFIFVLQTIWLYISELAGKDLDTAIIFKFLWLFTPKLIPLVLPLTILVSSLMVFGSLAENYEFAAMKSTGISLQRAMGSLIFFIGILGVIAFIFANNVIPYSEYKWKNLRVNISQVSPAMAITEGQFSSIGDDFNIKVDKKTGDKGQFLEDIIIHKKGAMAPNRNTTVIVAEKGELVSQLGSNSLALVLINGNYYDEIQNTNPSKQQNFPFVKSYFQEYTLNIDMSQLNNMDIDQDNELNDHNMFTSSELRIEIDSLAREYSYNIKNFGEESYFRTGITQLYATDPLPNTSVPKLIIEDQEEIFQRFEGEKRNELINLAINNIKGTQQAINAKKRDLAKKETMLNKHEIALHEKYVLAIACVVLFFVGAPLGAIIRKGGMGLPMVVAVSLFLSYHFIGIFAKNSAANGSMSPFLASWLSTLILMPLGVWLTIRATSDQGIFNLDSFMETIAKPFKKLATKKQKK